MFYFDIKIKGNKNQLLFVKKLKSTPLYFHSAATTGPGRVQTCYDASLLAFVRFFSKAFFQHMHIKLSIKTCHKSRLLPLH